jgi:hypothetical protein
MALDCSGACFAAYRGVLAGSLLQCTIRIIILCPCKAYCLDAVLNSALQRPPCEHCSVDYDVGVGIHECV